MPASQIPASSDELVSLYRSRTANLRLLVLLDNAGSAAQVRPLIPAAPGSVVIITSRARLSELAMDVAHHLTLGCFEADHAVELLHTILGPPQASADRDAALRVAALCHRLPLALTVAAATVATRPAQSLTTLAQTLASRADVLGLTVGGITVRGVIDVSYEELSDLARTVYRVVALHPSDEWGLDVAAAAVERPVDQVEAALQELVETNLVDELAAGRFRYHDLIRVHAARMAEESLPARQRDHAVRMMATFYRDRCIAADLVLRPNQRKFSPAYEAVTAHFATKSEAMTWFRRDREAALATLRLAVERDWTALACDLAEPMWALLLHDGHFRDVVNSQEAGAAAARLRGDPFEAVALMRTSFGLRRMGLHGDARQQCTAALALAQARKAQWNEQDLVWIESAAAHARGMAAEAAGDFDAALGDYEHSIRVEQQRTASRGDTTGYGLALRKRSVAWVLALRGDFPTAHQYLDDVEATMRTIMDTTGDSSGYGRTRQLRGRIHALAGEWEQARATMTDIEQILLSCGSHRWLIELYDSMAHIDVALHDVYTARVHLTAAQQLALGDGHTELAAAFAHRLAALSPDHQQSSEHDTSP